MLRFATQSGISRPTDPDRGTEGYGHKGAEGRDEHDDRRDAEDPLVGLGRDDVLFHDELHGIGNGLQHSMPPGAHRAHPALHVGQHLALHELQVHGVGQNEGQHGHCRYGESEYDVQYLMDPTRVHRSSHSECRRSPPQ